MRNPPSGVMAVTSVQLLPAGGGTTAAPDVAPAVASPAAPGAAALSSPQPASTNATTATENAEIRMNNLPVKTIRVIA
ncbi:hypothetical protein GCM10007973_04570 [Polymorphobacter multimanifer]|nr:hypothetical protein GCM10007973_04570 [Polymorphobacter multimanifer]